MVYSKRKRLRLNKIILDAMSFEVSLAGASNKKMTELEQHLNGDDAKSKDKKIKWTKAKHPLFENEDTRFPIMTALALGCDDLEGIKQCGLRELR